MGRLAATPGGRSALNRRIGTTLLLGALLASLTPASASGHAGLIGADPAPGARLGATPSSVRLTLSEQPEPSLSEIRVLGPGGLAEQRGRPRPPNGDSLDLETEVRPLARGVYTVIWKVVSAVDGHVTEGTYAFGVRASPSDGTFATSATTPTSSKLELVGRWIFLIGLATLLGAAVAGATRPGGAWRTDRTLARAGWALAAVGLLVLAEAQRRTAGASPSELLDTSVGHSLLWRAAALAAAALALSVPRGTRETGRAGLTVAAAAALVAIIAQVAVGHAAAGSWPEALSVFTQAAHFTVAGVWFGGLTALLLGLGAATDAERAAATRRFAAVALASLLIVAATGSLRAIDELNAWRDLLDSGYGRAVLAKLATMALIVALAARNRRGAAGVEGDPAALRSISTWELALAVGAFGVAALLGTLAPPVQGGPVQFGLTASGADFATTTRAALTTASAEPGPNRFIVTVEDYDSGAPLKGEVSLRFTPLDDPGAGTSSLSLTRLADGTYAGSGANLTFDGRWLVGVRVRRGDDSAEIPLQLEVPGPEYFVSALRVPGQPPTYTMQIGSIGYIRIEPGPEHAGPSRIEIGCYTAFGGQSRVEDLVLTLAADDGPADQQSVRRLGPGRFSANVVLPNGEATIGVVATTRDGSRLRGAFDLEIPAG